MHMCIKYHFLADLLKLLAFGPFVWSKIKEGQIPWIHHYCRGKKSIELYSNEHDLVKQYRNKTCKDDQKIQVKIVFNHPTLLPFK